MIPIEKNIRVVDAFNTEYEPTYPKRAKGLVKKGRARFIDATTIYLADPPAKNTEGIKMSENINPVEASNKTNSKYSVDYILEQIEKITAQTDYLKSAFETLGQMSDGENPQAGSPGNLTGQAKAKAIGDAVESRETTNQQLLRLYEKIYDDLKPGKQTVQEKAMELVNRVMNETHQMFDLDDLPALLDEIRHIEH